jgi:hypothetical protein
MQSNYDVLTKSSSMVSMYCTNSIGSPPKAKISQPVKTKSNKSKATNTDAYLTGDIRVLTKYGTPEISKLVNNVCEIWSGRTWAVYRIELVTKYCTTYKVILDNGSCITCAGGHIWPILHKRSIAPIRTEDLCLDVRVPPFKPLNQSELDGNIYKNAYELGVNFGESFIKSREKSSRRRTTRNGTPKQGKQKEGLPKYMENISPISLKKFMAGWLDSQKGNIFGDYKSIRDLQILLIKINITDTKFINRGTYYEIFIPEKSMATIPNVFNKPRNTYFKSGTRIPRIASIQQTEEKMKVYNVTAIKSNIHTIVADGILTVC